MSVRSRPMRAKFRRSAAAGRFAYFVAAALLSQAPVSHADGAAPEIRLGACGPPQPTDARDFVVRRLRTGQTLPQDRPRPRSSVVAYDTLTRPGARFDRNFNWIDPANYIGAPTSSSAVRVVPAGRFPIGDAWNAPLSPTCGTPMDIWVDDYACDATVWGPDPNVLKSLAALTLPFRVDNRPYNQPLELELRVLFFDAWVGSGHTAALIDGLSILVPLVPANAFRSWELTVSTIDAQPPIGIPRTGFVVLDMLRLNPPVGLTDASMFYVAGGDLLPTPPGGPPHYPPYTHVGGSDHTGWYAAAWEDNLIPPPPVDHAGVLNRNRLYNWVVADDPNQPTTELPHDLVIQLAIRDDGACPCIGVQITGECSTGQDALDYVLFNFGQSVPAGTNGDVDFDGLVTQDDLDYVLFDFGCLG